jgi:hypothetical protein
VYSSNGGLLSGEAGSLHVDSPLAVAPPRNFTNSTGSTSTSLFVRLIKFSGNASFSAVQGGGERFSVFLNLAGTYTLGSANNVTNSYLYVWGDQRTAIYNALTLANSGYRFTLVSDAVAGDFLRHREGTVPFRYTVVYSLVNVEG